MGSKTGGFITGGKFGVRNISTKKCVNNNKLGH